MVILPEKSALILVAVMPSVKDLEIARLLGWYRIPLRANPHELDAYLAGKENLLNFFFGQVMRSAGGKANPQMVRTELVRQLNALKEK